MIALLDSLSIHSALSVKHTHIKEWMALLKLQLTIKHKLINFIILTLNKLVPLILWEIVCVHDTVLCGLCRDCDDINTLIYMQLSRLAVCESVIIVYTVCDVTVLLGFKDHAATCDSVHRTRVDLDEIALFDRDIADELTPPALMNHIRKLLMGLCVMPHHKLCVIRTIYDVPALGLAKRAILILCSILIIWMHLYAQIVLSINYLDEQRESVTLNIAEQLRMLIPKL